jgi:hypothetical protein
MKKCPKCKIEYDESFFWKERGNKDGYSCHCIKCSKEKNRLWKLKNPDGPKSASKNWRNNNPEQVKRQHKIAYAKKRQLMNDIKQKHGCLICGEDSVCCLDFHHILDKDYDVTHLTAKSYKIILNEIAKCVIVCCNCHRKIHFNKIKCPDTPINISEYLYLVGVAG